MKKATTPCHRIPGVLGLCPAPQPSGGSQFKGTSTRGHCGPHKIGPVWPSCVQWSCDPNGIMGEGLNVKVSVPCAQCPNGLSSPRSTSSQGAQCPFGCFSGQQSWPRRHTLRSQYPRPPAPFPLSLPAASVASWHLQMAPRAPASSSRPSPLPKPGLQSRSSIAFVQSRSPWRGKLSFCRFY